MKPDQRATQPKNEANIATSLGTLARIHTEHSAAEAEKDDALVSTATKAAGPERKVGAKMSKSPHPAKDLSFMRPKTRKEGGGVNYWNVTSACDDATISKYSADCKRGRALAEEYLKYLGEHPTNGNITLLGCIAQDMIASSPPKGLVIGFMTAINEYAMSTARLLREMGPNALLSEAKEQSMTPKSKLD